MNNQMNWPIKWGWKCEICGNQPVGIDGIGLLSVGLYWGIVHARCYCSKCHTPYRMRDKDDNVVITPICQVKEDWIETTKSLWNTHGEGYTDLDDGAWEKEYAIQQKVTE